MVEHEQAPVPYGASGDITLTETVGDLRLAARALASNWPVPAETCRQCLEHAARVVKDDEASTYHRLVAAKVLVLLDALSVRRETAAVQERRNAAAASAAALREAVRSPAGREALARLSEALSAGPAQALPEAPGRPQDSPGPDKAPEAG
jgi:hypothetical protein